MTEVYRLEVLEAANPTARRELGRFLPRAVGETLLRVPVLLLMVCLLVLLVFCGS